MINERKISRKCIDERNRKFAYQKWISSFDNFQVKSTKSTKTSYSRTQLVGDELRRRFGDNRRTDRRMPYRSKMVVFSPVEYFYVSRRTLHCAAMAGVRIHLLPKGAGAVAQRSQTERAESQSWQTRVRRNVHDRGQRLGWRADIRSNDDWTNSGEF